MAFVLHWFKSPRKSISRKNTLKIEIFYKFTTGKPVKTKKQERLLSPFLTISSNFQKKKTSNANIKLNINNGIVSNLKNEDERLCSNCGSIRFSLYIQ